MGTTRQRQTLDAFPMVIGNCEVRTLHSPRRASIFRKGANGVNTLSSWHRCVLERVEQLASVYLVVLVLVVES